jgi:hypothetical protein
VVSRHRTGEQQDESQQGIASDVAISVLNSATETDPKAKLATGTTAL